MGADSLHMGDGGRRCGAAWQFWAPWLWRLPQQLHVSNSHKLKASSLTSSPTLVPFWVSLFSQCWGEA